MTYIEIASKLFFGLLALLVVTRLLGKKEMSQLTPFDFIYSIVLGGILEESIYDNKVSPFIFGSPLLCGVPCCTSLKNYHRNMTRYGFY